MQQLDALTLDLNTDVVEWCPAPAQWRWLAVGTYQLVEGSGRREGRLHLYSLTPSTKLRLLAAADMPGVFDLRWRPAPSTAGQPLQLQQGAPVVLAAALADGTTRLFALNPQPEQQQLGSSQQPEGEADGETMEVEEVFSTGPPESEALAVSLDFSRSPGHEGSALAVSYSDGFLQQFQATPTALVSLLSWQAHELEAWAAATDYWQPDLIYSGGDDCAFKVWDTRQGVEAPAWANRKAHGAGVCCVSSSPFQEYVVATGSYDENARLWDLRMAAQPVQTAEVGTGGGVWRLKWHPTDPTLLLAACMHAGFAVLRTEAGGLGVVEEYPHQRSLAYGSDWCREVGPGGASTVATCSFYDRLLHVWSPATRAAAV